MNSASCNDEGFQAGYKLACSLLCQRSSMLVTVSMHFCIYVYNIQGS